LALTALSSSSERTLKIYTFYTDSHKVLLDRCIESLRTVGELDVITAKFEQTTEDGTFHAPGWSDTMVKKLEYIDYSMESNKPFVHADCDIVFYARFTEAILHSMQESGLDIVFQSDGDGMVCMGFFACIPTALSRHLFRQARNLVLDKTARDDQHAVNMLIHSPSFSKLRVGLLGKDSYSIWRQTGRKVWSPGMTVLPISHPIFMHHANWVIGVESKIKLIDLVGSLLPKFPHDYLKQVDIDELPRVIVN